MAPTPRFRPRALVAGALLVLLAACSSGSSASKVQSDSSTSSTTPAADTAASAKGKPCVAVSEPLPPGAPQVPVKVGAPPPSLVVEDLTPGTGTAATASSTVTVDYIGVSCSTGKIFDSSYATGQPVQFPLSQVIPGWTQGLTGMKVGGTRLLGIPSDLAYGAEGRPPQIAPDESLWFVVQMKDVQG